MCVTLAKSNVIARALFSLLVLTHPPPPKWETLEFILPNKFSSFEPLKGEECLGNEANAVQLDGIFFASQSFAVSAYRNEGDVEGWKIFLP